MELTICLGREILTSDTNINRTQVCPGVVLVQRRKIKLGVLMRSSEEELLGK